MPDDALDVLLRHSDDSNRDVTRKAKERTALLLSNLGGGEQADTPHKFAVRPSISGSWDSALFCTERLIPL